MRQKKKINFYICHFIALVDKSQGAKLEARFDLTQTRSTVKKEENIVK